MMPQAPQATPRTDPPQLVIASRTGVEPSSEPLDEAQLVDLAPLWDFFTLLRGAVQRRPKTAFFFFGVGALAILGLFSLFPATYHTETRILAQRNLVMPALGNPHRSVPIDSDTPTHSVSETILTRENLLSLIAALDLQRRWESELAPLQRLKAATLGKFHPLTDEQKLDALVGVLEQRIHLSTDEGSVTIGIDWQNPTTAYDLVRQAQDNFLEVRHATEVSTIGETITILEHHASDARATMEQTLDQIEKARAKVAEDRPRSAVPGSWTRSRTPKAAVAETQVDIADLKTRLERKRQQIAEIEQERERQMGQLTAQLAQQRAIYAPEHPALVSTEQSLKNLSLPPPELAALEGEEQDLAEQVQRSVADTRLSRVMSARHWVAPVGATARGSSKAEEEDTRLEYPKTQLKIAADNYEDLLRRIDAARIELDTAQAAFKYRYRVIRPAEIPARAAKPKPLFVAAAAVFGGLALALLALLALDLRGNLIHSTWQVERRLGIPVLTELDPE